MFGRLHEWRQQLRVGGMARALYFALLGEWGRLQEPFERSAGPFTPVGPLRQVEPFTAGAHFHFARASLEVTFLQAGLVRLSWYPGMPPIPYAVVRAEWPDVATMTWISAEGWHVASTALRVTLAADHSLRFYNWNGRLLRQEALPERRRAEWRHSVVLRREEHVYGLGEHTGRLNRRGSTQRLWNTDPMRSYGPQQSPLYFNIPVHLNLHDEGSYLIFYENSYPATFHFGERADVHFEGGMLRYYVSQGPPERAYKRYSELTGRPSLYHPAGPWAFISPASVTKPQQMCVPLSMAFNATTCLSAPSIWTSITWTATGSSRLIRIGFQIWRSWRAN